MGEPANRLKLETWAGSARSNLGARLHTVDQALVTRVLVHSTSSSSIEHPPTPSPSTPSHSTTAVSGPCSSASERKQHPLSFCSTYTDNHDATHLVFLDSASTLACDMSTAAAPRRDDSFSPPQISAPAENWDDDFLFQAEDSPAKPPPSRPRSTLQVHPEQRWSSQSISETGGWDEELEREEAERQSSAGSSSLGQAAGAAVAPRTDLSRWAETDEGEVEDDFGFAPESSRRADTVGRTRHRGNGTEDTVSPLPVFANPGVNTLPSPSKRTRTNTSPSRSSTSNSASARSSPVMHTRQLPDSPALSLFSMSTSTAQQYTPSLASSTAHLRTTRSHENSTAGPFVPAQPRVPRRRLRKKSRPARPGDIAEDDGGVGYVMQEPSPPGVAGALGLAMTEEEGSWSESSHQHDNRLERTPSPPPIAGPSSPPTRTPLLSRIGSLKTKLGRRPKSVVSASPPSAFTSASSTGPVTPNTPARVRAPRSSTTPKQKPFSPNFPPETPNASGVKSPRTRAPSWFRAPAGTAQAGSSPEELTNGGESNHGVQRRKSKEPFWKGVGSFSSGRSPVLASGPSTDASEHDPKSDHESTVKKPPRKSLSTTTRPPLPLPLPPHEEGSPTPPGGKLTKSRRPMSMATPSAIGIGKTSTGPGRVAASLGRGTGAGWASVLGGIGIDAVEDGDTGGKPEKGDGPRLMRSLRKFSSSSRHSRKKSTGEDFGTARIPSSSTTGSIAPASSTTGSRVPSSSTGPSLHESNSTWAMNETGGRKPSGSFPRSASAVVLSSNASVRDFDPSGSVFTLPIGLGGDGTEDRASGEVTRPSLTVDLRTSSSYPRPSSPLAGRPNTPHAARPSSPLATRRPSTPLHRPSTPLAGPPVTSNEDDFLALSEEEEPVKDPITPSKPRRVPSLASVPIQPIVYEDGVEFAVVSPVETNGAMFEKEKQAEECDAVPPVSTGRPSLSSGRTSSSFGSASRSKLHRKSASLAHTKSSSEPARLNPDLLPPIELQPPSPPQTLSGRTGEGHQSLLQLTTPPKSLSNSLPGFTTPSSTPSKLAARLNGGNSPIGQSSSLSRAATQPGGPLEGSMLRRNSLSDLKIPARISRAQSGLKSNLGMVREFAGSIEQIRGLQSLYRNLLADLKYAIENGEPLSPVLFPPASRGSATSATLVRVPSRDIGRVADRLNTIDERYGLWWECAEVLVELGGGSSSGRDGDTTSPTKSGDKPPSNASTPAPEKENKVVNGRERAITLAGDQSAPGADPTGAKKEQWDKERGELSPRQLQILREMLSTPDPSSLHVPLPATNMNTAGYLNALHPGGTASAITLPSSSASSSHVHGHGQDPRSALNSQSVVKFSESTKTGVGKIRRASRVGITGIRDLLKHLNIKKPSGSSNTEGGSRPPTRQGRDSQVHLPMAGSQVNLGMQSQANLGMQSRADVAKQSQVNLGHHSQLNLPRQSQTHLPYGSRSHGPAMPPNAVPAQHKSPRRPSLASIFRLNSSSRSKSKSRAVSVGNAGAGTPSTTEDDADESDWDRMDSASDLDLRIKLAEKTGEEKDATLRGRKSGLGGTTNRPPVPALPAEYATSKSQVSLNKPSTPDEAAFGTGTDLAAAASSSAAPGPVRSGSNRFRQKPSIALSQTSSSVQPGLRSAPLQSPLRSGYPSAAVEGRLALTPETIKPLLEYAREVSARLGECVAELRELGLNDGEKLTV